MNKTTGEAQDLDQLIKRAAQKAVMATDYDDEDAYIIAEQQVEPILRELLNAALAAAYEKGLKDGQTFDPESYYETHR